MAQGRLRTRNRCASTNRIGAGGLPASTVHTVLVRVRRNRLGHIDRVTSEPVPAVPDHLALPQSTCHASKREAAAPHGGLPHAIPHEKLYRNRGSSRPGIAVDAIVQIRLAPIAR